VLGYNLGLARKKCLRRVSRSKVHASYPIQFRTAF
jgi:hypothetical protein